MKHPAHSKNADEHNIGVGILILDTSKTKILLGKRKNSFRAGTWGIPSGRVGMTETIEKAMIRELDEETGIKPVKFEYLGVVREYQKELSGSFVHFIFKCTKYAGEIKNMEADKCEGWIWHDIKRLPKNVLKGYKLSVQLLSQRHHFIDLAG